ncbi:MAG: biotin/lipoyl-containing protein [Erysipelotrichales bacterium]
MDIKLLEDLSSLMNREGLNKLKIDDGNFSVHLERGNSNYIESSISNEKTITMKEEVVEQRNTINAPLVGTFYQSAGSGAKPYVEINQSIKKGDVLCIIEAMKVMNEIVAQEDGVIKDILVKDEMIVEFDQPLFVIE